MVCSRYCKWDLGNDNLLIVGCEHEADDHVALWQRDELCVVCSRYRKWDLGNDIVLIARCEHDAVMYGPNNEVQFINVKSLNEWDSRVRTALPRMGLKRLFFRVFVSRNIRVTTMVRREKEQEQTSR